MTKLAKFLEPIGRGCGHSAYRMDSTTPKANMRKEAGLGTCNCCDYFLFDQRGSIVLLEDTRLLMMIRNLKAEYSDLPESRQTHFVTSAIRKENRLKVYGSMLVLCRLAAGCSETGGLLQAKKYKFWLVVTDMDKEEDTRFLDDLRAGLLGELKSVLTPQLLDDVSIIPIQHLAAKLSRNSP